MADFRLAQSTFRNSFANYSGNAIVSTWYDVTMRVPATLRILEFAKATPKPKKIRVDRFTWGEDDVVENK